jgi:hypothetical protein
VLKVFEINYQEINFEGNMIGVGSTIMFPHLIADSKQKTPGAKPGPPGWRLSVLSKELQNGIKLIMGDFQLLPFYNV